MILYYNPLYLEGLEQWRFSHKSKRIKRNSESPVDSMCRELEKLYNNGIEIGENRGQHLANIKSIKNVMANLQKTAEEAMEILGINEDERINYLEILK